MKGTVSRARSRRRARWAIGMTLLEVLVSLAILAMIALLIYGAFDAMNRGKRGEAMRAERARSGRQAVQRIGRELESAFLSLHQPQNPALATRVTHFIGHSSSDFDRVDFAAFAHTRTEADAKESDQCEVGYFVVADPDAPGEKMDLVRREQTPIDADPKRGGVVNVVAENVEGFDLRYLDPLTGQWVEQWDTTQATGQVNRMPLEIKITLTLKGVPGGVSQTFATRVLIPIRQPLTFGIIQ